MAGSIELDYCARGLRYAKRIVAGKIPACELVQLACERQLRDLKQKGFPWQFSRVHGNRICRFIENLPHVQGTWDSRLIHLEDWQCFKFSTIFGWVDPDGNRRFRRVYDEEPRKNAKTTTAAGVGLYLFAADGEPGAEVYCLAPETPVLDAQFRWIPIGSLQESDELLGFDEFPTAYRYYRKFRESKVESVDRIIQPRYRIILADGRTVVASAGHLWLGQRASVGERKGWIRTDKLVVGSRIRDLGVPWPSLTSYGAGYLAGVFDGEACFHGRCPRSGFRINFAQRPGVVMDEVRRLLTFHGYNPSKLRRHSQGVQSFEIARAYECFRFLGQMRPKRLLSTAVEWYSGRAANRNGSSAVVASVEYIGMGEVIAVGTSTGTLFANGLFSHNCAARTRDQAKHTWGYADKMVRKDRSLRERFQIKPFTHHMELSDGSVFRPLHRESGSLEGLNVHGGVIDELHAHDSRDVFDVLDSATGSRRQPLLFIITTAAADVSNVCAEQHDYVVDILRRLFEDETYWGMIYTINKEDDWTALESARKANPNYGVSVIEADLEAHRRKALHNPQAQSEYKRKRLCIWGGAADAYFNILAWREVCRTNITLADVEDWEAFFALDLASKSDLAALMMLFRKGRQFACFGRYYVPEDALDADNPNLERYQGWQERENFTLTDGNLIDYDVIESDLLEYARRFRPREIAFDPWNATQLATRMTKKALPMVESPMTVKNLSEPMKTLAGMIPTGDIQHDGDPILTWAISNTNGKEDAKENVYPRKSKDEKKIDPAVALLMCFSRAFATAAKRKPHCLTHGPIVLNLNA